MTARRIVFVIFDGLQPIDLVGPHEVFSYAGLFSPDGEYQCQVVAPSAGPVRAPSGLPVHAAHSVLPISTRPGSTRWWWRAGWGRRGQP